METGPYNFQGYLNTGERGHVSRVPSTTAFPWALFVHTAQGFSRGAYSHTRRKSASNINTCQCRCEYIARQYMDTDISVQHNAQWGRDGRGRTRERRTEAGRHSNENTTLTRYATPAHDTRSKADPRTRHRSIQSNHRK